MSRILTLAAIAIILIGGVIALYFVFFGGDEVAVTPGSGSGLPTAGQGTPFVGNEPGANGSETTGPSAISARLVRISAGPVVPGMAVVNVPAQNASSSPDALVRYVERTSGNLFAYSTKNRTITRTSNKTVPGVQSASWLPSGATVFLRYLSGEDSSTVNTYGLSFDGAKGFFLGQNLTDIAVSSTSVLALASGVNGSSATVARADGSQGTEAFTTPLSSIRVGFAGRTQYFAFTKPSVTLPGTAFLVTSGALSSIAGPLPGLVALASPSGKWVLVSFVQNNSLQMQLVNSTTGAALTLPVGTIADKCGWTADDSAVYCGVPVSPSRSYAYPDDWYQGAARFSDRIWKIQVEGRYAQLVLDFSKEVDGAELDAESLALDPSGTVLVFTNKNDGSLWAYSL